MKKNTKIVLSIFICIVWFAICLAMAFMGLIIGKPYNKIFYGLFIILLIAFFCRKQLIVVLKDLLSPFIDCYYRRKSKRAVKKINEMCGFDIFSDKYRHYFDIQWNRDKPYILILQKHLKSVIVRREFYEFLKGNWVYVGYMDIDSCYDFYWFLYTERNRKMGSFRDNTEAQKLRIMDLNMTQYFDYYLKFINRNKPPNDGAVYLCEKHIIEQEDPEIDRKLDKLLREL